MSETKDATDKTLRSGTRKPLSLNRTVDSGHVQQKFSHGRSKSVVVEKKRKRLLGPGDTEEAAVVQEAPAPKAPAPRPAVGARPVAGSGQPAAQSSAQAQRTLSDREQQARASALSAERRAQEAAEADRQRRQDEHDDSAEAEAQAAAPVAEATEPVSELAPSPSAPATDAPLAAEAAPVDDVADAAPSATATEPAAEQPVDAAPAPTPPPLRPPPPGQQQRIQTRPAPATPPPARPSAPASTGGRPSDRYVPRAPRTDDAQRPAATARPMPRVEGSSSQSLFKPTGMTPMIISRRPPPKPPEAVKKSEEAIQAKQRPLRPTATVADVSDDDDSRAKKRGAGGAPIKTPRVVTKGDENRVRGKLTITNAFDESQRQRSLASLKRRRDREKLKAMGVPQAREKVMREVTIPEAITIQDLANRMTERAVDVIKLLMKQGTMHKINDVIDADTAELIVTEFGHTAKRVSEADVLEGFIGEKDADEATEPRAPVVTIMGHVDHGKTSLLDAIRHANVVSGEAGGITQHIGAYQVVTDTGHKITFIDTPGHEAFTAMRARGAKVTDIVVLVVAADDGVMPQTIEALNHAKAAGVPMIVAINKIDKPDADPKRVTTELLQHEIVVESLGGDVLDVPVSAIKRTNLDKLLEAIVLQSEILELRANPNRNANGYVIEAKLERGRGPVGTLLVERGTLRVGDIVVAGKSWGRVRALIDDKGDNVKEAGPSVPVEVLGFDSAPEAGDEFSVVESDARAREISDYRVRQRRDTLGSASTPRTLEGMMQQLKNAGKKEFPLVIKGDVQGSVEAISGSLKKISTDEVEARLIHTGVGGITESDVSLANASKAIVIGFNVRANIQAKQLADSLGLEIRYYNIIYDLVDEVKAAMSGLLAPTRKEVVLGHCEILQVFDISKVGKIAGARVTDGKVERGARLRLIRDNVVILQEGKLSTLKRFKDDVREVVSGQECGIAFENFQDLKPGDVIECYQVEIIKRSL